MWRGLGQAFLVEPLLVLLVPLRLEGLGLGELLLRSRSRVVRLRAARSQLTLRRMDRKAITTSGTATTAMMIHGITRGSVQRVTRTARRDRHRMLA